MKGSDMTHDDALVERVSDAIWSWTEGETPYVPASEIIALVQADLAEKLLSEEAVEAAAKALYDFDREGTDRPGWGSLQSGHHTDGVKGRRYYRYEANAALYAALDVLLGKENADDR